MLAPFPFTLANFCKSKKYIIFNLDYRPESKKSKFELTLIRHSPFNVGIDESEEEASENEGMEEEQSGAESVEGEEGITV